jgi:DNA repair protein RecO (recombination protein O)
MTLRRFEKHLLKELGYALTLDHDVASGEPIHPGQSYQYMIERGPVRTGGVTSNAGRANIPGVGHRLEKQLELTGLTLLDMLRDDYSNPVTLQQSKALMRMLINHYLGNQTLNTRQLLKDLQQL